MLSTTDGLGENLNVLDESDLERLMALIPVSYAKYNNERFRITVEDCGSFVVFAATSFETSLHSSFTCISDSGEIKRNENCDISWIRAFLNGYKEDVA